MDTNTTTNTTGPLTTADVMRITGKSRSSVNRIARMHKLGRFVGQMRVFRRGDLPAFRRVRMGNPNWRKGVPQRRKIAGAGIEPASSGV